MIAVDSNVLIYAHRVESELHLESLAELRRLAEGMDPWALPVFCIAEFLRVTTHRRVFRPPSTLEDALVFLDQLIASPRCLVLRPGPRFTALLREIARAADARGNLVFDAQIAALCEEHGISTILTADRDFLRFPPLDVRLLESTPSAQS